VTSLVGVFFFPFPGIPISQVFKSKIDGHFFTFPNLFFVSPPLPIVSGNEKEAF